jgi:hypothetical protein
VRFGAYRSASMTRRHSPSKNGTLAALLAS